MVAKNEQDPYELSFEHGPAYLYASLRGNENNYDIAKQYWNEIIAFCNRRDYSKVLIEKQIPKFLDTQDAFRVVTEVSLIARRGVKFAFFDKYFNAEKSGFEELVDNNRGLTLKYFESLSCAEHWLAS